MRSVAVKIIRFSDWILGAKELLVEQALGKWVGGGQAEEWRAWLGSAGPAERWTLARACPLQRTNDWLGTQFTFPLRTTPAKNEDPATGLS